MRDTERFTLEQMVDYTIGWDAEGFRGEGDYTEYVQTYIMRPLSSGRRAERERPAASAARAGAGVGAPRVALVRGRSGTRRGQGASWPTLPTTMTCRGQGGETYQIPIASPPADHELVGFYDLPPASSEYTRQSLELTASMMGCSSGASTCWPSMGSRYVLLTTVSNHAYTCFTHNLMHHIVNTTLDTQPSRLLIHCNPQTVHSITHGIHTLHSALIYCSRHSYTVLIHCVLHSYSSHGIHILFCVAY